MSGETPNEPKPAAKMKRSPIWIIVLVLLLLILAGAIIRERTDLFFKVPASETPTVKTSPEAAAPEVKPAAAEKPGVASWVGYANPATGFEIQYPPADPKATLNPEAEPVQLEPAVGDKERTFRIEIIKGTDARADSRGCVDVLPGPGSTEFLTINGLQFCLVTRDEGAAGSTYRSYIYSTEHEKDLAVFTFVIRFPTTVRVYAGCETDADQSKPFCVEHAFDETRDAALFRRIMDTIVHN